MYYKETPKRVVKSESGEIVYLVEWWCPECNGNGCRWCGRSGVMDGLRYAWYNAGPRFRDRRANNGAKRKT